MRKLSLVMAALALVLGLSQCKKENKPVANGEKQRIVLTADNGNDGSKVSAQFVSETLNLTWDGDETITVTGGAETEDGKPLAFKDGKDSNSATFEGDINVVDESELFTFTVGGTPDYLNEDGGKEGLETWIHDNISLTGTTDYQPTGQYSVNMKLPYAVLKLSVSAFVGTAKDSPTPLTITVGDNPNPIVKVTDVTSLTEVFVAVPADGVKKDYIISCNGKTATKSWTLEPDIFYTKDDGNGGGTGAAIVIEPDAPTPGGTVTTGIVEDVTAVSAKVNYSIEPNAASQATEHGVCYGTSENPDVDGSHVVYSNSSKEATDYSVQITGLTSNTKYYARAYVRYAPAKDGNEVVVYGDNVDFTTLAVGGTVTTGIVENVTAVSAKVNYSIEPNAASQATEHGVCYGTSENPDVDGSHVVYSSSSKEATDYSVQITGLTSNTKYYARAYARYAPAKDGDDGVVYGDNVDFTTKAPKPEGTLSGQFSIDDAGHMVYFTKGHLQFQPSTQHWRFASNQYDRLHATTVDDASSEYNSSYTGWIELFGWGTSNQEYGATCWRPWETDATDTKYGNGENNLSVSGKSDWGYNDIYYDDTHTVTGFRTLTGDEFNHIINRPDGRGKHLCGFAKVHGVPGIILLPDNWDGDFFVNWNRDHHESFAWIAWEGSSQQNGWANVINNDLWDAMEEAGAVFLPCLGSRNGKKITCVETSSSRYWSSSVGTKATYATNYSFYIGTYKDNFLSTGSTYRHLGCAVRLVYDPNN